MTRGGGRQGVGDYKPQEIEAKWQKRWAEHRVFETEAELDGTAEEEKSKPAPLKTGPSASLRTKGAAPGEKKTQDPGAKTAHGAPEAAQAKARATKKPKYY